MKKIRWMITAAVILFLLFPMGSAEAGTKAGAGRSFLQRRKEKRP